LPTEPIALLDRLAADAGTLPGVPPQEVGEPLLRILTLPWLTEQQRRAAIEAVGLLPGAWKVTGHSTINGAPALTIAYDEGGIRSEITLAGTLPGIWSARKTLIDPLKASAESSGTLDGLAPGTVILDQHVTAATAVASNTATP
jgi:hypothetical protein